MNLLSAVRKRARVFALLMCSIAVLIGLASPRVSAGPDPICAEGQCGGAGICVNDGQCYPGYGNTGDTCQDGQWVPGCN